MEEYKQDVLGGLEDDKPPPDLPVLHKRGCIRMVSGYVQNYIHDTEKQSNSSIDSVHRKFCGTFGFQEFYSE